MRGLIALILMVPILAGCVSDEETRYGIESIPSDFALPECSLQAGDIDWPDYEPADVPTAPQEVTIKRDAYGVPHVYADDRYALFYTNGYVQAQDRLFMMDVLRLVGYGESARYLGTSQLASDIEVRQELYTVEEIEATWQSAPVPAKQVLQAFADGVNRYMAEMVVRNELPGEFAAVGRVPPPWTPQDSLAVINYLIGFFGVEGGWELHNLQVLGRLQQTVDDPWTAFNDYSWTTIDDTYTTIAADQLTANGCEAPVREPDQWQAAAAALDARPLPIEPGFPVNLEGVLPPPGAGLFSGFKWGSNALVVDGSITDTGMPIMWGAPQMGYFKPPVPHQIGLHGAGFDAVGIGVTGAPGIVIGRNADIAWSVTSGNGDQVDLVELTLDGPRSFDWAGDTVPMDCWTSTHQLFPSPQGLAGAVDTNLQLDLQLPVTYDQEICRAMGMPVVAINEEAGYAWAKRTSSRGEELMGALMWLQAPLATSFESLRETMQDFPFSFNFHVASRDGVGYLHTGNPPLRAPGYDVRLPTPPGPAFEWQGEAYTQELGLSATDPSRGYFANWNNAPAMGWRAGDRPYQWGPVHRVQQIDRLVQEELASDGSISFEDVARINHDAATVDSLAVPVIAAMADLVGVDDPRMVLLDAWAARGAPWADEDGDGYYDDEAHALWDHVFLALIHEIQGDELGDLAPDLTLDPLTAGESHAGDHGPSMNRLSLVLKALQGKTDHDWCDDVSSPGRESCAEQVRDALDGAIAQHVAVHQTGFTSIGGATADERPMINKGSWVQVVSMAEPERSVGVMPPGNSARLNTAELALLIATGAEPERITAELDLYWSGGFKPLPLTAAEVDAAAVLEETLTVLPPLLTP